MTRTRRLLIVESQDPMSAMVAGDISPGSYVNLGIGQPTLVADHLHPDQDVVLHTENGMLNMGPPPPGTRSTPT